MATKTKAPTHSARNRKTAARNAKIYNAVVVDGKRQADVGKRFGLAQCTVSQIVNNPNSHTY